MPDPAFVPKALIFDMDGTLADTMPGHFIAWSNLAQKYGFSFPEDRFYSLGGVPTWRICKILLEEAGREDLDAHVLAEEKEAAFVKGLAHVKRLDPIVEIAEAHVGKLPMAVATGGYRRVADPLLEVLGIRDWFGALVTADDVENHKPNPDTFLKAAEALGVDPADCRAFEDTDIGLQAIRSAGMDAVDIRPLVAASVAS